MLDLVDRPKSAGFLLNFIRHIVTVSHQMKEQPKEWFYGDDNTGKWVGPLTLAELDSVRKAGTIEDYSRVTNAQTMRQQGPMSQGMPYYMISRLNIDFTPTVEEIRAAREGKPTTVFSGPNNGGKTLLLKQLYFQIGQGSHLVACNRFSHVDVLNTRQIDEYEHRRYYESFSQQFHTSRQNTEDSQLKLEQVLTSLKNVQRDKLFGLSKDLLGNKFSLQRTDPESDFSPFYVDMDGENPRLTHRSLDVTADGSISSVASEVESCGREARRACGAIRSWQPWTARRVDLWKDFRADSLS
jgi:molybdopterin-guanine dinucleotide biosynthesis protein